MTADFLGPIRRLLTFRLATLLATVSVLAIGLGFWVRETQQQRAALASLRQAFPDYGEQPPAYYDYQVVALPDRRGFHFPFNEAGIAIDYDALPTKPSWLVRNLGVDFCQSIVAVALPDMPRGFDVLGDVAHFRNLQHLSIQSEYHEIDEVMYEFGPTDVDIAKLRGLQELKSLEISIATELTDDALRSIESLQRLEMLELWGGKFSDAGLSSLGRLRNLAVLLIAERSDYEPIQITDDGVAWLAGLENIEQLHIDSKLLTGTSLRHLGRMQKLTWLGLQSPKLTDEDLRYLAPLARLEWIEFIGTHIDGSGFKHLTAHTSLRSLSLGGTLLNDEGLAVIAQLPNLEWMNIWGTHVTAAGLAKLKNCPRLKTIVISPDVPGDLQQLKQTLAPCEVTVRQQGSGFF